MAIRSFSVSLDEEVVARALKISNRYGSKLSPLLNQMMIRWCEEEEEKEKINGIHYRRV